MGALRVQTGIPTERGDKYFDQAEMRGASVNVTEASRRKALENSDREAQKRVAIYLLQKDPKRGLEELG